MQMNHLAALKFLDEYLLHFQKVVKKAHDAEPIVVVIVVFVIDAVVDYLENSLTVVDVHKNIQMMNLPLEKKLLPLSVTMDPIPTMQFVLMVMYVQNDFPGTIH